MNDKIMKMLAHIRTVYENQVVYNYKVNDIYRGQLKKYVEESMKTELSAKSFERAKGRIPPINLLQQLARKTNRTYAKPAIRKPIKNNKIDQELITLAVKNWDLDSLMAKGSDYLTLHKYFAFEFAINEIGDEICNVLSPDKFVMYSEDKYSPNKPTAFIKLMGNRMKSYQQTVDVNGNSMTHPVEVIRNVEFYHIWDKEYFYEVDADGDITEQVVNPYGFIPVLYCRVDNDELMPTPDSDVFQMAILFPKILADLNYAIQFCSHSIMYGVDVDPTGIEMAPDAFWNLKSVNKGDQVVKPEIGTINPSVDTDKAIGAYKAQLAMWLESKGLKVGAVQETANNASGVSKELDEADATAIREEKVRIMEKIEVRFWDMYKKVKEVWVGKIADPKMARLFSTDFELSVEFAEQQPNKDTKQVLEEMKLMKDLGIITTKMMLQTVYPNKSDKEIEAMLVELKAEKEANMAEQQALMGAEAGAKPAFGKKPAGKPAKPEEKEDGTEE